MSNKILELTKSLLDIPTFNNAKLTEKQVELLNKLSNGSSTDSNRKEFFATTVLEEIQQLEADRLTQEYLNAIKICFNRYLENMPDEFNQFAEQEYSLLHDKCKLSEFVLNSKLKRFEDAFGMSALDFFKKCLIEKTNLTNLSSNATVEHILEEGETE